MNLLRSIALLSLLVAPPALAERAAPTEAERAAAEAKVAGADKAIKAGDIEGGLRQVGEAIRMVRNGEGAHRLGHMYEGQPQVPNHEAEALKWFQYAAELRQPDAMHHVGRHYLDGTGGLPRDFSKGYELMEAASEAGYWPATEVIVELNEAKEAAEKCLVQAMNDMGMQRSAFGGVRYFRVTGGEGAYISGDTFALGRYGYRARLTVEGFEPWATDEGHPAIALGVHKPRPASGDAERLAEQLRRQCGAE